MPIQAAHHYLLQQTAREAQLSCRTGWKVDGTRWEAGAASAMHFPVAGLHFQPL